MSSMRIKSNIRDYDVFFEVNFQFLADIACIEKSVVVIDRNVYSLYREYFDKCFNAEKIIFFDATEAKKNIDSVIEIYEYLTKQQAKRNLTLISIGGGITQDVTGFAASTLYRGIDWIFVPTTLLAQTDSCIGSKTSLNLKSFKNLIGTFYPPSRIYINPQFIKTLNTVDFYSGIGEIVKLQLMKEEYPKDIDAIAAKLNNAVENHNNLLELIRDSLEVKAAYMENDEFDLGKRNMLNYGHCFGHAIETSSAYAIPHGIAINIGMILANAVSMKRGLISEAILIEIKDKLNMPTIPIELHAEQFDNDVLLAGMKNDKKRIGTNLAVIIPDKDFRLCKVTDVTENEFSQSIDYVKSILFDQQCHKLGGLINK